MSAWALGSVVVETAPDCPVLSSGCCVVGGNCCDGNVGGVDGGFCMPVWAMAKPAPNTRIKAILNRCFIISSSPLHSVYCQENWVAVRTLRWSRCCRCVKKLRPLILFGWIGGRLVRLALQLWNSKVDEHQKQGRLKKPPENTRFFANLRSWAFQAELQPNLPYPLPSDDLLLSSRRHWIRQSA